MHLAVSQSLRPFTIFTEFLDSPQSSDTYRSPRQDIAGKTRYDFQNSDALRVLTQTLLKRDFQLEVEIPPAKLVPTLPNRLNYLLWLEDIVNALQLPEEETVTGLDVGG